MVCSLKQAALLPLWDLGCASKPCAHVGSRSHSCCTGTPVSRLQLCGCCVCTGTPNSGSMSGIRVTLAGGQPVLQSLELLSLHVHLHSKPQLCGCSVDTHASDASATTTAMVSVSQTQPLQGFPEVLTFTVGEKETGWSPAAFITKDPNRPSSFCGHPQF